MDNYYDGAGKYQSQFDTLTAEFVPASGKADTLAGEAMRSVLRLNHDFYNNGMGNDTSGALNFIKSYISCEVFDTIYEYTRGRIYNDNYGPDFLHRAIVEMTDQVLSMIVNNPQTMTIENTVDMLDLSEGFLTFCDACGDECDNYSSICEMCEEEEVY